jgi:hypothetical protein
MYPFSFLKSEISFTIPSLTLEFNSIANANLLVGNARDVDDWNTFFDLPTNGNPFTLVKVVGKKVNLVGGSNISIPSSLFSTNQNLISVVDNVNCIVNIGQYCFDYCESAVLFSFPAAINVYEAAFAFCSSATSFNLPSATLIENYCFEYCTSATFFNIQSCENLGISVLNNSVFSNIVGNTITLEVARLLLSCNVGSPDGDIQYLEANNTVTVVTPLSLEFNDISNASLLVGDASDFENWNTFFDLPTNGTPFTSVNIYENTVKLIGGAGINLKESLFQNNTDLLSIVDAANCITSTSYLSFYQCSSITKIILPVLSYSGSYCFGACSSVTSFSLPSLTTANEGDFSFCESATSFNLPLMTSISEYGFENCISATSFYLPSCTNLGATVENNNVFINYTMISNTITLTVPSALMTCNSGDPDGDIEYLQANNTVTVITV